MHAFCQPNTGPTRTDLTQTGRSQPYGTSHTRPSEYGNAEAGPSTLTAPLVVIPYVDPSMSQPSGGYPRLRPTQKRRKQLQKKKENKASVSSFYCTHIPRIAEWSLSVRSPNGPGPPRPRSTTHQGLVAERRAQAVQQGPAL